MKRSSEVLAVIPARGGSKGLPGKNICPINGHPLIAYSIASARASKRVTRVIVSTDSPVIAEVARRYGAETPFMRPRALATDRALDLGVFCHALRWLEKHEGYRPDLVVQLRPTSPLRPKGLIDEAVTLMENDRRADCVRGVTRPSQNPYKMWKPAGGGRIVPLIRSGIREACNRPRQELPQTFWQTGHLDVIRPEVILKRRSMIGKRVRPVFIEPEFCVDIDSASDAERCRAQARLLARRLDRPQSHDWPRKLSLLVLDFDGVFTDNRVWVDRQGRESVAFSRSDGMGIERFMSLGVPAWVLSSERNPIVAHRCRKLGVPVQHGIRDKAEALKSLARRLGVELKHTVFVGNDINDVGCMRLAGHAVAVADAAPRALAEADWVLTHKGGFGAVREICELLLDKYGRQNVKKR